MKRKGFTLVEIIVATVIIGLITPTLVEFLRHAALLAADFIDYKIIMFRIAKVESTLKSPVYYCGYGMPHDPDEYKKAFGNQSSEPFNWPGPVSVRSYSGRSDAELCVAYGTPSGVLSYKSETSNGALDNITVQKEFTGGFVVAKNIPSKPSSVKNWIMFGCTTPPGLPLAVRTLNGRRLRVSSAAAAFRIDYGSEAHYFRAGRYHCNGEEFQSVDFRSTGEQPRVRGITDVRFKLNKETGTLTIYIISRGNQIIIDGPKIRGMVNWPVEYGDSPAKGPYRYYVEKIIIKLPNYRNRS